MKEFWSKNKRTLLLIGLILILASWIAVRERRIRKDAAELAVLQERYKENERDRDALSRESVRLKVEFDSLQKVKQKVDSDLKKKQAELYWLQAKHKREIDSLVKNDTPLDTLYFRTAFIFPNYDNGKLLFPYSGSQVKQLYFVGVNYPRLKDEYELSRSTLNTCLNMNKQYAKSETNLQGQLSILKRDVGAASDQITSLNESVKLQSKVIARKTFWQYIEGIAAASGWLVAALK